jgi:DeoR/GlpR family transcriptional regulator of sugar metabolism
MAIEKLNRKDRILEIVKNERTTRMARLCSQLDASEATIRRDLAELAAAGLVRRVHGGVSAIGTIDDEPRVIRRGALRGAEKRAIGSAAAALVKDRETVFLGSGSTVLEVARHLVDRTGLQVITNSLPIINLLADAPGIQLVASGGFLRNTERSMVGFLVERSLAELRADKVIIGAQGIHPVHGLTDDWMPELAVDRAIVHFAPELIVVADSSKIGKTRLSFVTDMSNVKTLVTDAGVCPEARVELERRGVRVLVAEVGQDGRGPV